MEMVEKRLNEVLTEDNMFFSDTEIGVPSQRATIQDKRAWGEQRSNSERTAGKGIIEMLSFFSLSPPLCFNVKHNVRLTEGKVM